MGSENMTELENHGFSWKSLLRPSILLGLATLAIHLAAGAGYGFFRDELYFIVCGQRPALGYVDQPPLVPLLAAFLWKLSGGSHFVFELFPAALMAVTVSLSAEFARSLGGGRFSQFLAGLCVFGGGVILMGGTKLSTDVLQPLAWLGCSWCIVRLVQSRDERWWLAFGAIVGISFLTKYMILLYVAALLLGILATPLRRSFLRPWLWVGAALALLIMSPNLWWQYHHGWPFLELARAGAHGKNVVLPPLVLLAREVLLAGVLAFPVWLAGLWSFGIKPKFAAYRAFSLSYIVMLVLLVVLHGKDYYIAAIYPTLFAGGAVWAEAKVRSVGARAAYASVVAAASLFFAPFTVPLLSVSNFIQYERALNASPSASASEHLALRGLPQDYADMFGWKEMAEKVAAVYNSLPPEKRAKAVFFGNNYGEAAAIDLYGRALGLPPAICAHNNYYLWGRMGHDGNVIIVLANDLKELNAVYQEVTIAGRLDNPYAMPYETNLNIVVASGLKVPFPWERLKHYE